MSSGRPISPWPIRPLRKPRLQAPTEAIRLIVLHTFGTSLRRVTHLRELPFGFREVQLEFELHCLVDHPFKRDSRQASLRLWVSAANVSVNAGKPNFSDILPGISLEQHGLETG